MNKIMYRGIVKDELRTLPDRKTRTYSTYELAHRAAERLCRRTYGDRGSILVEIENEETNAAILEELGE